MEDSVKKSGKTAALITYIIAFLCILCGLFLPFGNVNGAGYVESMLGLQLLSAVNALFGTSLPGQPLTYGYSLSFFGLGNPINLGAIVVLLYALVAVAALFGLFIVIFSKKTIPEEKKSGTGIRTASVIEIFAVVTLGILVLIELSKMLNGGENVWSYALIAALGGTLLMLVVQSIIFNKGSGVIKLVLFLLSAISLLILLLYPLSGKVSFIANLFGGVLAQPLIKGGEGEFVVGLEQVSSLFETGFFKTEAFTTLHGMARFLSIATLISSILILVNLFLDAMGLGKSTNGVMVISNAVRYGLELITLALALIFTFVLKYTPSYLFYGLVGVALVQLIINIIRCCKYFAAKKSKKAEEDKAPAEAAPAAVKAPAEGEAVAAAAEPVAVAETRKERKERIAAEKAAAKEAAKEAPAAEAAAAPVAPAAGTAAATPASTPASTPEVYSVAIYDGPTDEFIETLSNEQKIEFAKTFLERKSGKLPNIPKYEVGETNQRFFSSIFIYYSRVRGLVSDGLMDKLYDANCAQ